MPYEASELPGPVSNLDIVQKLTPLARRLSRLLDKIAYPEVGRRQFHFDVRELVCERMGGTDRELSHIISRLLMPACEEMERIGLIRKEPEHIRLQRRGRGAATVYFEVIGSASTTARKKPHGNRTKPTGAAAKKRPEHRIFQGGKFL